MKKTTLLKFAYKYHTTFDGKGTLAAIKAFRNVNKASKEVKKALGPTGTIMQETEKKFGKTGVSALKLAGEYSGVTAAMNRFNKAAGINAQEVDRSGRAARKHLPVFERLGATLGAIGAGTISGGLHGIGGGLGSFVGTALTIGATLNILQKIGIMKWFGERTALMRGTKKAAKQIHDLDQKFGILNKTSRGYKQSLRGLSRGFVALLKDIGPLKIGVVALTAALVAAGAALAGLVIPSALASDKFDDARVKLKKVVGLSEKETQEIKKQVLGLAQTHQQLPSLTISAAEKITSSGARGNKAMGMVKAAADGAKLGLGQVDDIANTLIRTLKVFERDALTPAYAMDVLAVAVNEANWSAEKMALALPALGLSARNLGMDLAETSAVLAGMSKVLSAEETERLLKQTLVHLESPSPQAMEEYKALKLDVDELRQVFSVEGLTAGIRKIDEAANRVYGRSTVAYAQAIRRLVQSVEGKRGFEVVLQFADLIDSFHEKTIAASGTVQQRLEGDQRRIAGWGAQISGLFIQLGEGFLGVGEEGSKVLEALSNNAAVLGEDLRAAAEAAWQLLGVFGKLGKIALAPIFIAGGVVKQFRDEKAAKEEYEALLNDPNSFLRGTGDETETEPDPNAITPRRQNQLLLAEQLQAGGMGKLEALRFAGLDDLADEEQQRISKLAEDAREAAEKLKQLREAAAALSNQYRTDKEKLQDEAQRISEAMDVLDEDEGPYKILQRRLREIVEELNKIKWPEGKVSVAEPAPIHPTGWINPKDIWDKLGIEDQNTWDVFSRSFGGDLPPIDVSRLTLRPMSDVEAVDETKEFAFALGSAVEALHGFSYHLDTVFKALGMEKVGDKVRGAVGAVGAVQSGVATFKKAREMYDKAGGLSGIAAKAGAAGPLLPLVAAGVGIFAFMKIRAARRAKREKRRHQEQMFELAKMNASLSPFRKGSAGGSDIFGRYWHGRATDQLRIGGVGPSELDLEGGNIGTVRGEGNGPPSRGPSVMNTHNSQTVNLHAPITVNATEGMTAQDVAQQVQRRLNIEFRQAAADFA